MNSVRGYHSTKMQNKHEKYCPLNYFVSLRKRRGARALVRSRACAHSIATAQLLAISQRIMYNQLCNNWRRNAGTAWREKKTWFESMLSGALVVRTTIWLCFRGSMFVYLFVSFIHPFIHASIHSFIHPTIHSFIYSLKCCCLYQSIISKCRYLLEWRLDICMNSCRNSSIITLSSKSFVVSFSFFFHLAISLLCMRSLYST